MLRGPGGGRVARVLTDAVSPAPVGAALLLALALHSAHSARQALLQAVIAIGFGTVLPLVFIVHQVRTRRITDVHVGERGQRPLVMAVSFLLGLTGFGLLLWAGATRALIAAVVAGLAGILICLAVTVRWKISIHLAVLGGASTVAGLGLGPWWALGALLTVPVGWSRVRLGDHTLAQVAAGAAVGASIAALIYPLVTH